MSRNILIASGKGGTGKTRLAASLGRSLSEKGLRVLVLEGQTGVRSLDLAFGVEEEMLSHFGNVLKHRETLEEAALQVDENLYYLPSPQTVKPGTYQASDFEALLHAGENLYDYILVDAPSGVGADLVASAGGCDEVLLTVTPKDADFRVAGTCLRALHKVPPLKAYLVINRIKDTDRNTLSNLAELLPAELLALIPEEDFCTERLADRLKGEDRPLEYPLKRGLKSRFMNLFGNSR